MAKKTKSRVKKARKTSQTGLSAEDRALWAAFSQAIDPLEKKSPLLAHALQSKTHLERHRETHRELSRRPLGEAASDTKLQTDSRETKPIGGRTEGAYTSFAMQTTARPTDPASPTRGSAASAPASSVFDRKTVRKISKGRKGIDAKSDLPGLRPREAFIALRGCLHGALQKGHRTVLVITGKGRPARYADHPEHFTDYMARVQEDWQEDRARNRGVLRQQVPQWLSGPEFADMVAGYTTAHARHGGDGAFYVQLRRRGSGV